MTLPRGLLLDYVGRAQLSVKGKFSLQAIFNLALSNRSFVSWYQVMEHLDLKLAAPVTACQRFVTWVDTKAPWVSCNGKVDVVATDRLLALAGISGRPRKFSLCADPRRLLLDSDRLLRNHHFLNSLRSLRSERIQAVVSERIPVAEDWPVVLEVLRTVADDPNFLELLSFELKRKGVVLDRNLPAGAARHPLRFAEQLACARVQAPEPGPDLIIWQAPDLSVVAETELAADERPVVVMPATYVLVYTTLCQLLRILQVEFGWRVGNALPPAFVKAVAGMVWGGSEKSHPSRLTNLKNFEALARGRLDKHNVLWLVNDVPCKVYGGLGQRSARRGKVTDQELRQLISETFPDKDELARMEEAVFLARGSKFVEARFLSLE